MLRSPAGPLAIGMRRIVPTTPTVRCAPALSAPIPEEVEGEDQHHCEHECQIQPRLVFRLHVVSPLLWPYYTLFVGVPLVPKSNAARLRRADFLGRPRSLTARADTFGAPIVAMLGRAC